MNCVSFLPAGYNSLEETREPILEYIRRQNAEHIEREQVHATSRTAVAGHANQYLGTRQRY